MKYTLTVGTATHYDDIAANKTVLKVPFEITDEQGNVVSEQIHAFPLAATADEIKQSLERALRTYTDDANRYEKSRTRILELAESVKTATEISRLSLSAS